MDVMTKPKLHRDATASSKECRTCEEVKPIDEFYYQNKATGARQSECKLCMHNRNTAWKHRHIDRMRPAMTAASKKSRRRNPKTAMIAAARNRATIKGEDFLIVDEDVVVPEFCPVLGIKLEWPDPDGLMGNYGNLMKDNRPSIDRIDNTKGYVPGNIVVVSYRANRLKSDATVEEMRKLADYYEGIT
jgi:hypothetical protein